MKFADLHLHTRFSDGTYSPEELVEASKKAGLSAISVADHDTVEGIPFVMEAAAKEDIEVIPGIELTAEHNGIEIHILGYLFDYKNSLLLEKLNVLKSNRIERIYKIADKLKAQGLNFDPQSVFNISGKGTVGRLHVARAMVKKGLVGSIFEAFNKYIGDKSPAYVLGFKLSPKEAVGLIRASGGIPVLAHPYTLRNDAMITELIGYGIMGLEAYYPEHSQGTINHYLELAKEHNLLVTGGSDCHGQAKPEVLLGSVKIPYEIVEKLKSAKNKL